MTLATFSSHAQRKESCKYGTHDCLFVVTSLFCNFSLFLKGKFYWVSWSMYFWYVEGVRPGCWWSGYGSRGNNVPECHSCSCWKHCQVKLCVCVLFPHVTDGLHCSLKWISVSFLFSRTIDRSVFKPIVQISVIGRSESSDCHLLAVTHAGTGYKHRRLCLTCWTYSNKSFWRFIFAGVRLYFTTAPFALQHQKHIAVRPSLLALVHVRLPPGFSASSTLQKPSKVHKALYSKGRKPNPKLHQWLYCELLEYIPKPYRCFAHGCLWDGG